MEDISELIWTLLKSIGKLIGELLCQLEENGLSVFKRKRKKQISSSQNQPLTPEQQDELAIQSIIEEYIEYPYTMKDRFRQLSKIYPEAFSDMYKGLTLREMKYRMELLNIDGKLETVSPEKIEKMNLTPITDMTEFEKENLKEDILIKQQALKELRAYMESIATWNRQPPR